MKKAINNLLYALGLSHSKIHTYSDIEPIPYGSLIEVLTLIPDDSYYGEIEGNAFRVIGREGKMIVPVVDLDNFSKDEPIFILPGFTYKLISTP